MQRITLKSVAEKCDVSLQTVSKILNGNKAHLYKEETRNLVREAARELGYRPNAQAQAMKQGRFKTVMMLRSQESSYSHLSIDVMMSIQNKLEEYGYKMMITVLPAGITSDEDLPRFFHENYVDGVLININKNLPPHLGDVLDSLNIPKVRIGGDSGPDSVRHNDYESAYNITKRFLELGHTRIVYSDITSAIEHKDEWHFSVNERLEGYRKAMEEAEVEPIIVLPENDINPKDAVAFSETNIFDAHNPTAVVAYGAWMTGRSILYACARRGIKLPEDLSLVLWNDEALFENDCEVSCFIPASATIGTKAAELIYGRMEKKSTMNGPIVVPFEFVEGETIAPPKK